MTNRVDVAIFGAGLSGLAIGRRLLEQGRTVLLIDPYTDESNPGVPAGLVNPATGKRARPGWRVEACYRELRTQVETLDRFAEDVSLFADSGVLRPALDESLAENYRRALTTYDWPDGWVEWLDAEQLAAACPAVAPSHGGLRISGGFTLFVGTYLNLYRKWLRGQGAAITCRHATYKIPRTGEAFTIRFRGEPDQEPVMADQVLVAAGANSVDFPGWQELGVHPVKGQIVHFESPDPLPWKTAVSARGYFLRVGERGLLAGSTYEHDFEDLQTTDEAFERIRAKVSRTFPKHESKLKPKARYAGVRVTTPNRLPVIGRHPKQERLLIYTGMNSTGLLYSEYTAGLLADHMANGTPVPDDLSAARLIDVT